MKLALINVYGGMGNQMFQFCLYARMKKEGVHVCLNIYPAIKSMNEISRATIFHVFKLDKMYPTKGLGLFVYRIINKMISFKCLKSDVYYEKVEGNYDLGVFASSKHIFDGYWQNEKYFASIRSDILSLFQPRYELDAQNIEILNRIENSNSVSVHVRLGDYLTPENKRIFGDICTKEYYYSALNEMLRYGKESIFYVFSNDVESAQRLLKGMNCVFVDLNDEKNAWKDMYLMSRCKHNIIANSTFSWWGAWLNCNEEKIVIAPKKWVNTMDMPDICPKSWIRL